MNRGRPLARLACRGPFAFLTASLVLAGCGGGVGESPQPPPLEVRRDVAPLVADFPELGAARSAAWVRSDDADERVPGPTTTWIDAVVHLDPDQTTALVARYLPIPQGKSPEVPAELRPELPPGPYLTSAKLDLAFTTPAAASAAYLDPMADVVVLLSTSM